MTVAEGLATVLVRESLVALFQTLHREVHGSHVHRGRLCSRSDRQLQTMHGERVRQRRRLEVDVEAAVEVGASHAVDQPPPVVALLELDLSLATDRPVADASPPATHSDQRSISYQTAQGTPSSWAAVHPMT